jgi:hypothetical protein
VPAAAEHAVPAPLTTPAAVTAHGRPVVRAVSLIPTPTHRDPDTPPAAPDDAIPRERQAA